MDSHSSVEGREDLKFKGLFALNAFKVVDRRLCKNRVEHFHNLVAALLRFDKVFL